MTSFPNLDFGFQLLRSGYHFSDDPISRRYVNSLLVIQNFTVVLKLVIFFRHAESFQLVKKAVSIFKECYCFFVLE